MNVFNFCNFYKTGKFLLLQIFDFNKKKELEKS